MKKRDKNQRTGTDARTESVKRGKDFFFLYFLLVFFSDLRKSDRRFSSELKAKLVYATRATHRYQYHSLLSNFKR